MEQLARATLFVAFVSTSAQAQVNAGAQSPEPSLPFTMTQVAAFSLPWRIAFLPDGQMLITEKVGPVWLVGPGGQNGTMRKISVGNVPTVLSQGQGGMLGVYVSPNYATDKSVYLTYSEPGDSAADCRIQRVNVRGKAHGPCR